MELGYKLPARSLIDEFDRQWDLGQVPDVGQFVSKHAPVSPSQLSNVLLIDLSRRWSGGDRVSAEEYFQRFPDLLSNPEGAIDLLFAEFLLREKSDPTISIDVYADRFPQFAGEFRRQIAFHRTVGVELLDEEALATDCSDHGPCRGFPIDEVPGYKILHELGRGGLGVVYLARDTQLNRNVALKMLLAGKFASENLLKRLLVEAEATARMQHPNIVQIYEVGQHDGCPFLALEYIEGGTLAKWMESRPQPPMDAAKIIHDIAAAIQFAHEKGVVHRDLKPGNLLIQAWPQASHNDGFQQPIKSVSRMSIRELQVKVADFGLAKFVEQDAAASRFPTTKTGDLMGTAAYMSPEQAHGESSQSTVSTDIYSLGAILYELLTGRPPFVGVQPLEVLSQVIADEPIRPSQLVRHIPRDLQTICLKCLEKSPARRYRSAVALAEDLQRFLSNQPIVARHTMMIERGWRWCRRNPVKTTMAASVASLLLMVAMLSSAYSIMLGNQLRITTRSEMVQKALTTEALDQLWEASLSQADALRTSRQVGQRFESLKAIDRARALGDSIQFEPSQIDRMRNSMIACLALPDMRIGPPRRMFWPDSILQMSFDDACSICAYLLESKVVVVLRIEDEVEIARFENVQPESKLLFSPDGSKLAIFHDQCRVYRLADSPPTLLYESTSSGPWAFTSQGNQLIGTDGDGLLKLVDLQKSLLTKTLGSFREQKQIAASPDARRVAMWIDRSIQVVDLESGRMMLRVAAHHESEWQAFAWHSNSKYLAIDDSYPEGIVLWDIINAERIKRFPLDNSGRRAFCFDAAGGRLLVYNDWSKDCRLWDVYSGEPEFSRRGPRLLSLVADRNDGFRLLQSVDSQSYSRVAISCPSFLQTLPTMRIDSAGPGAVDLTYSYDGRFIVYYGRGEIELFDATTLTSLVQAVTPNCHLRFKPDGSLLTLNNFGLNSRGQTHRGLNHWKLTESSDSHATGEISFGPPEAIFATSDELANTIFETSRDGKLIAGCLKDGVLMWRPDDASTVRIQTTHRDVRRMSISPDGKRIATAGWNSGNICVWDTETGQLQLTIPDPGPCTVTFSPDGRLLAKNAGDITVFETKSWTQLFKLNLHGTPGSGVSICFSPDSTTLAASDSFGHIHLVDARDGREFLLLTGQTEKQITSLHFSPDGRQLAAISAFAAHVWKLDAIRAELESRNLGWQTGAGTEALGKAKSDSSSSAKLPHPRLTSATFVFDRRFKQLEAAVHVQRAVVAAEQSDFATSQAEIARAVELEPEEPYACRDLAWLLVTGPASLRDAVKAIELARSAMQNIEPSQRGHFAVALGVALYRAEKFEQANEALKVSLASSTPETQLCALYFLSMCNSHLGDHTAAHDFFVRAESLRDGIRSELPFDLQMKLNGFSKEAKLLLK